MPIYVYGCEACGHRFEQTQRFQDDPLQTCPNCGAQIRRIMQPTGIVFKGSGWHSTDYRVGGAKPEAKNGEGTESSESSADTKPDGTDTTKKSDGTAPIKKSDSTSDKAPASGVSAKEPPGPRVTVPE